MYKLFLTFIGVLLFNSAGFSQKSPDSINPPNFQLENIEKNLGEISKSVRELNALLKNFSETFSSQQGLRLTDKQQRILAAFEYLNRAEQRLATLQNFKIDLTEKQARITAQIAVIDDDLREESIERSIALRGTTDAEELRNIRRTALIRQKSDLRNLSNEISRDISETDNEIQQTQQFLKRIRIRIFPEIEKELEDL